MITELIIKQLEEMGFELKEVPEIGYVFQYEESNMLFMPDEDDDSFVRFSLPHIYDVTDDNMTMLLEIINELNVTLKFIKVCALHDGVWVIYEHRFYAGDNLEDLLGHILRLLQFTAFMFQKKVNGGFELDIED